jgi:hypothetical protein
MAHVLEQRTITIVAGVSQSGKSTFALRYMLNATIAFRFIFDPGIGSASYAQRLQCDPAADAYDLALGLCRGWVLFNPHPLFPGRLNEAFQFFCEWAFQKSQHLPGRKLLMVDEAWKYTTPQRYPTELANCVQAGGHHGLECMFNTQNPARLNEAIKNECSELVCFQLHGEKSLGFVADQGFDPAEVERLEKLQFVSRHLDSGAELRGRITI